MQPNGTLNDSNAPFKSVYKQEPDSHKIITPSENIEALPEFTQLKEFLELSLVPGDNFIWSQDVPDVLRKYVLQYPDSYYVDCITYLISLFKETIPDEVKFRHREFFKLFYKFTLSYQNNHMDIQDPNSRPSSTELSSRSRSPNVYTRDLVHNAYTRFQNRESESHKPLFFTEEHSSYKSTNTNKKVEPLNNSPRSFSPNRVFSEKYLASRSSQLNQSTDSNHSKIYDRDFLTHLDNDRNYNSNPVKNPGFQSSKLDALNLMKTPSIFLNKSRDRSGSLHETNLRINHLFSKSTDCLSLEKSLSASRDGQTSPRLRSSSSVDINKTKEIFLSLVHGKGNKSKVRDSSQIFSEKPLSLQKDIIIENEQRTGKSNKSSSSQSLATSSSISPNNCTPKNYDFNDPQHSDLRSIIENTSSILKKDLDVSQSDFINANNIHNTSYFNTHSPDSKFSRESPTRSYKNASIENSPYLPPPPTSHSFNDIFSSSEDIDSSLRNKKILDLQKEFHLLQKEYESQSLSCGLETNTMSSNNDELQLDARQKRQEIRDLKFSIVKESTEYNNGLTHNEELKARFKSRCKEADRLSEKQSLLQEEHVKLSELIEPKSLYLDALKDKKNELLEELLENQTLSQGLESRNLETTNKIRRLNEQRSSYIVCENELDLHKQRNASLTMKIFQTKGLDKLKKPTPRPRADQLFAISSEVIVESPPGPHDYQSDSTSSEHSPPGQAPRTPSSLIDRDIALREKTKKQFRLMISQKSTSQKTPDLPDIEPINGHFSNKCKQDDSSYHPSLGTLLKREASQHADTIETSSHFASNLFDSGSANASDSCLIKETTTQQCLEVDSLSRKTESLYSEGTTLALDFPSPSIEPKKHRDSFNLNTRDLVCSQGFTEPIVFNSLLAKEFLKLDNSDNTIFDTQMQKRGLYEKSFKEEVNGDRSISHHVTDVSRKHNTCTISEKKSFVKDWQIPEIPSVSNEEILSYNSDSETMVASYYTAYLDSEVATNSNCIYTQQNNLLWVLQFLTLSLILSWLVFFTILIGCEYYIEYLPTSYYSILLQFDPYFRGIVQSYFGFLKDLLHLDFL